MPELPTLTVTQEQADRAVAAWGGAVSYKQWLRAQVAAYVKASERAAVLDPIRARMAAAEAAIDDDDPLEGAT